MSSHYSDFPSNVRGGDLKMKHRRAAIRPNHAESPLNCAECRRHVPCAYHFARGWHRPPLDRNSVATDPFLAARALSAVVVPSAPMCVDFWLSCGPTPSSLPSRVCLRQVREIGRSIRIQSGHHLMWVWRFVVATTEELHEKNQQLSYRIRVLEEALQTLHSERSTVPHPLLSEALLRIKTPLQREPLPPRSSNTFILGDVTGPQGSMSIHDPRVSRYHSGTANSLVSSPPIVLVKISDTVSQVFLTGKHALLRHAYICEFNWRLNKHGQQRGTYASEEVFNNLQPFLPPEILTKASMMPISYCPISNKANLQCLLPYLPTRTISMELRSLFYTYASWM